MELFDLNTIRIGLTAAVPVLVVTFVAIAAFSGLIYQNAVESGETGSKTSIIATWMAKWTVITLVFGVIAAIVFAFINGEWGWGQERYLALALAIAVVLTVLEFLPMYDTKYAPNWQLWTVLNFAYAIGFGYLVPKLTG